MISLNIVDYQDIKEVKNTLKLVTKTASKVLEIKEKLQLNVVLCNNDFIREYNKKYRNIDKETDVLTFPSDLDGELGDVLISVEKAELQKEEYGHSFDREMGFLLAHGILHSLGYDHQTKDEEEIMFNLQEEILKQANLRRN